MSGVRRKRIVSEIPRTKSTANDLGDIDDPREFAILGDYPIPQMSLAPHALQIGVECLGGSRSRYPGSMQPPALSCGGQELRLSPTCGLFKNLHSFIMTCPD